MTTRDLSQLDIDQLISVFDSLGRSESDFKASVTDELVNRFTQAHSHGFAPCPNIVFDPPPEVVAEHLKWLAVYERVKDNPEYQRRVSEAWSDLLRKTCPNGP
jgi:hypothetical protein